MRASLPNCVFLVLLGFAAGGTAIADDEADDWGIARVFLSQRGEKTHHGYVIYSTNTKRSGAAFRCDNGKLYAIFSLKGVPIGRYLTRLSARPRDTGMVVQIDSGDAREETWVSMFYGKLYMARSLRTTSELYRAVVAGAPVILKQGRGNPVTIEYPAADESKFDRFLSSCNLEPRNAPFPPPAQARSPQP